MKSHTLRIAAAALLSGAMAMPALAADTFRFDVTYDAAAAETPGGAEALHARLTEEVTRHCTVSDHPARFLNEISTRRCVERTLNAAVEQIDTPAMDAVHAEARNRD